MPTEGSQSRFRVARSSEFDQAQRRGSPLRFLIASLQLRALYAELWNELCEVQWHPKQLASAVEKYRDPSEKRAPREPRQLRTDSAPCIVRSNPDRGELWIWPKVQGLVQAPRLVKAKSQIAKSASHGWKGTAPMNSALTQSRRARDLCPVL